MIKSFSSGNYVICYNGQIYNTKENQYLFSFYFDENISFYDAQSQLYGANLTAKKEMIKLDTDINAIIQTYENINSYQI